jgi:hypothetical protein
VSYALACLYGLSLIYPEYNMKFQKKLKYLISQIRWSSFDRISLHRRRVSAMKIGPTSFQVTSGRGKVRTVANLGASGDGD